MSRYEFQRESSRSHSFGIPRAVKHLLACLNQPTRDQCRKRKASDRLALRRGSNTIEHFRHTNHHHIVKMARGGRTCTCKETLERTENMPNPKPSKVVQQCVKRARRQSACALRSKIRSWGRTLIIGYSAPQCDNERSAEEQPAPPPRSAPAWRRDVGCSLSCFARLVLRNDASALGSPLLSSFLPIRHLDSRLAYPLISSCLPAPVSPCGISVAILCLMFFQPNFVVADALNILAVLTLSIPAVDTPDHFRHLSMFVTRSKWFDRYSQLFKSILLTILLVSCFRCFQASILLTPSPTAPLLSVHVSSPLLSILLINSCH